MCPGSGTIRDNLGLSSGPALGDAPPAYHRPMAFDLVRTTYGPAALDALAAAVARAKGDEPLRPVTVVVPSNYAGVAARRALARRHGVIGVGFVTLYRLAELLAGPTLARSGRVPVSSPVVATAFRAALAEDPGLFGPVADQPSTVEALRRVHRELRDLDDLQRHRLAQSDARAAAVVAIDERVTERLADPLARRDGPDGRPPPRSSGTAAPWSTSVRSSSTCRSRSRARRRGCSRPWPCTRRSR